MPLNNIDSIYDMPITNPYLNSLHGQLMRYFARNSSCDIKSKRHIIQMYFCNKANNILVEHSPLECHVYIFIQTSKIHNQHILLAAPNIIMVDWVSAQLGPPWSNSSYFVLSFIILSHVLARLMEMFGLNMCL